MFYKMTGSGNDFVVLDGRSTVAERWPPTLIRAICDRRSGVGADGLVILTPSASGTVRMAYWNSDGSPGAMCGNAALCSGRLAVQLEMVPPGEFCLLTDAGVVPVRYQSSGDDAEINLPDFDAPEDFSAERLAAGERWMMTVTVGVPHLVIRVDDIEGVDVAGRGRLLRFSQSLGPAGANVNFVSPSAVAREPWLIRTYERGVEGETLACGTGTVAAAAVLASRGDVTLPLRFRSRGGPELAVRAASDGSRVTGVWLGGQGRLVFHGVWDGI
jgi:diaminopimelate epimerase